MQTASDARILEHEPGDLTCIVEGGIRLSALRAALAEHGQRLSLDPPGDPTLAECLLDDLSGPLRHRFGTMRDLVIGVTVVLPDGTARELGRQGREERRGLRPRQALLRLARGRLGSVERLALRLHPLPAAARTVVTRADWQRCTARSSCRARSTSPTGGCTCSSRARSARSTRSCARSRARKRIPGPSCASLQASLPGRVRWDGSPAPLVRPGPRVAYVAEAREPVWSPLAERVREAMCSPS